MKTKRRVYGPVPSRRLGFSLGVDLIPFKTCPFDCVYCQLGPTTDLTARRGDYVPEDEVIAELEGALRRIPPPDFIALSGSGEPTLHSGIGRIIAGIRKISRVPVAVLTNGALLGDGEVGAACLQADVVIPSLDAGDEGIYQQVNRPVAGLTLDSLVEGVAGFRERFPGEVWLEVMVLGGINDSAEEVRKIARLAGKIRPRKIHLNTPVRPASEESVRTVTLAALKKSAPLFDPVAEVILDPPAAEASPGISAESVLDALERRPCTIRDIAAVSGLAPLEVLKVVEEMARGKRLRVIRRSGRNYYAVRNS